MSNPNTSKFLKYGAVWPDGTSDLEIERSCIRKGGRWQGKTGMCGTGLFEHYMNFRKLVWPSRYRHRWTDLIFHNYLDNNVTILLGPASSQKTSGAAECVLIDWWCNPENTLVLLSTTKVEKLRMGIFGELQMLWKEGQDRFPFLAGNLIHSEHAIAFDNLAEDGIRDMRKGIVGRALYSGARYVGIGHWAGIKQKRIRFIADELQFCDAKLLDVLPNMMSSTDIDAHGRPDFKFVGSGNPKHDPYDPLSLAAAPKSGWLSLGDIKKTTVWENDFLNGKTVNLIGTDSPNFDVEDGVKPPYPRLISRVAVKNIEKRWGKNSMQYYSQCVGKMMMNMVGNRVLTKEICDQHNAFGEVVWRDDRQTRIMFLDPAYGGIHADRCVWGWLDFGIDITGKQICCLGEMENIPFLPNSQIPPEDQIAQYIQKKASSNMVDPENIFYDSTGKGTVGASFARVFGTSAPIPIYFGGNPTARPVRHDLYIEDEKGVKRLKRCDEEYRKLVTELWFAVRLVVECGQQRRFNEEVAKEFYMREYALAPGGKIEVETKDETRERMGMSPDLADAYAVGIEGARQRGFRIENIGTEIVENQKEEDFFEKEVKEYEDAIKDQLLKHS